MRLPGFLIILLMFGSVVGQAAPAVSEARVDADRTLVDEATKALVQGRLKEAREKLEQAYVRTALPEILYQLGRVAQSEKRELAAADLYRRYLGTVGDAVEPQLRNTLEQYIVGIPGSASELEVISGDLGAFLRVDGSLIGMLPLATPILLTAGEHRFKIEKGRQAYETHSLSVPAGQRMQLPITFSTQNVSLTVASPVALLLVPDSAPSAIQAAVYQGVATAAPVVRASLINRQPTMVTLKQLGFRRSDVCARNLDCQEQLGRKLDAEWVLTLTLEPSGTAPSRVSAQVFDVATGTVADSGAEECAPCSVADLQKLITGLSQTSIQNSQKRGRGSLTVSSDPPGARVVVGGRALGQTPYSRAALEGPMDVKIQKNGYQPYQASVQITRGQETSLQAPLPLLPDRDRIAGRPRWRFALGGIAIGSGLVLAGFGASAIAAQGACVDMPAMPILCNNIYTTGPVGGILVGTGAALTLAGVLTIAWPGK